jgi:glycine/D-amino acid oxidase-like deaminating enzyme
MSIVTDVVIVGAGIVGAACAHEFAKRKLRVHIVDEGVIGGGATAASMGHIVLMDDSLPQFALTNYSQTLWEELYEHFPPNVEHDQCGTIWIARDGEEMTELRRKSAFLREHSVEAEILDEHALHEAEPNLCKPLAGGLLVRQDSIIYPPAAVLFLLEEARKLGASVCSGKRVVAIRNGKARLADGTVLAARIIVNAAGQFASKLVPGINMEPRKGHLVITDRYPCFVRHQLVELGYVKSAHSAAGASVAFNVQPRKTGHLLIGSSRQHGVAGTNVETSILSQMLNRAFQYLPELKNLSAIRAWTGFRAATPDKLPLIGPWPQDSTLYLATGHEGLGVTTSLATARILCDQILGIQPAIPIESYMPSRQVGSA